MKFALSQIRNNIGLAGACLLMAGFCFSRALMSISILIMVVQPLLNSRPVFIWKRLTENRVSLLMILFFLITAASIFHTSHLQAYYDDVRILLPFLLFPLALTDKKLYRQRNQRFILMVLMVSVFVTGVISSVNYLQNYTEINREIAHSSTVPIITGINHIYYGFLLAFATLIGGYFIWKPPFNFRWVRYVTAVITLGNLVFLHMIASRTGLGTFYVGLFLCLLLYIIKSRRYLLGAMFLTGAVVLLVLSIRFVPALQLRYEVTREDVSKYVNGEDLNYYSISMRLEAWRMTWEVIRSSPWFGVGSGDVIPEVQEAFNREGTDLIPVNRKGPHNQYLQVLAGTGIPGLLVLLFLLFYPLPGIIRHGHYLGMAMFGIMISAMFFESALERQVGATFFAFFWPYLFHRQGYREHMF